MYKIAYLKFIFFYLFLSSCSTKKDILYIQDISSESKFDNNYIDPRISYDDILKIDIFNDKIDAIDLSNPFIAQTDITPPNSVDILKYRGYSVNNDGDIFFPKIGSINVIGLTTHELENKLKDIIINEGLLIDPTVRVKIINMNVTILGEVKNPGRYNFTEMNLNIFSALGLAGDLTINGIRNDIKVIRRVEEKNQIFSVDLTSQDVFNSEIFQIFSGDVIIVNQNSSRIKNAGIIGNSGTLLSLLSFILSSIIVINN